MTPIDPRHDITGLVLAGGRGTRMGGLDKGLQYFEGEPLALRALQRLAPQIWTTLLSANRNTLTYEFFGAPVVSDNVSDYPGPLAGFLVGLAHCRTPCLLTVPCDAPRFPLDLARRLTDALNADDADIAMVSAPEVQPGGHVVLRPQPVFCLLRNTLRDSLDQFVHGGGRKVSAWTAMHRTVQVPFDRPGDAPDAFFNVNTLAELQALERR
ncbi:molybdenum cofactor guanylyltransferase MobA [Variovorax sp. PAMC 28711]|uniref:molybdenum cofactor guanylyltransferase MobA n=1 Tax=Variovorax sp. PAMC 28711 TaxID=1795631 RepID=UPI00078BAB67|nr:molybdenum cofactor guanylyltransferase MobA [Variovorax sp. PAMC 28711]AMM22946.1 molybdenum cofactor guanylyltransferase [Variovorax sp. PAMC 28711]